MRNEAVVTRGAPAADTEFADDDRFEERGGRLAALGGGDFDLRDLRAAIIRNRWVIAGIVGACVLVGLIATLLTTPIYRATTSLQIEQRGPQIFDSATEDTSGENTGADDYLQTQVQILQSRSVADRVARSLNFFRSPSFFEQMDAAAPDAEPGSPAWQKSVISRLQENLNVEQTSGTRLVSVSFDSPEPRLAQAVANAYGEEFIASTLQRRFDTSAYSRDFLSGQLEQTRQQLEESERALIDYARSAGITDVLGGSAEERGGASLTGSNLAALNNAYSQARSDRILAEQRWRQAQNTPTMQLPEVLNSSTMQSLTSRRAQLQAELQGEQERRSPGYPTVLQLRAQLESLDEQIQAEAARIRSSIREEFELASQQESELRGDVRSLREEALGEQSRGVQLTVLQREADTNRALYDALLQRFRELNAAAGITANNISVIDEAQLPGSPIWPNPLINALLSALVGFGLAGLVVFARERLDDTIRSPDEVENKLGLPLFGITPLPEYGDTESELENPHSATSEAIYALKTALELSTRHGLPRSLLVTSTKPNEGKTTTSFALARELAKSGSRVVLIDADLRRPSLHHLFKLDNSAGFSNLVSSPLVDEAIFQQSGIEGLTVITSGPLPPSPPRLLGRETLERTLAMLNERFDVAVFDSPPVLGIADALQLSSVIEASLFVVEANGGSQGQTKTALRRLASADANLIGVVLTKFNYRTVGYSDYSYGDYFGYNSKSEKAEA